MPRKGVWLYDSVWSKIVALRRGVKGFNFNRFLNESVLAYIASLDGVDEGLRLEAQVDILVQRLDRVHREQKSLLRHGSYAIAYGKELRGLNVRRLVTDAPPYNVKLERPALTEKEIVLVEKMIVFRRATAEELYECMDRLMDIRGEGLDPELVDRVRQTLKVSDIPQRPRRVPEGVDDLVKLPPGTARRTPEEIRRMKGRSGDPVIDEALKKAWIVEDKVKRLKEAGYSASEAKRLAEEEQGHV